MSDTWQFRYVCEQRPAIDISVFMPFLERLIAVAIVQGKIFRGGGLQSLHATILPRSWMLLALQKAINIDFTWLHLIHLVQSLGQLLVDVYHTEGTEKIDRGVHLTHTSRSSHTSDIRVPSFVSRLLKYSWDECESGY